MQNSEEIILDESVFGESLITDILGYNETATVYAFRASAVETLLLLKLYPAVLAGFPIDIVVVDSPNPHGFRFSVIYIIRSLITNLLVFVLAKTNEALPLISSQSFFAAFNWAEREVWDFFGISFTGHPDFRRILTDYGFTGYPLRKDFPLTGYGEVHFDDILKSIEYRPVELTQAFRVFRKNKIWGNEE